MQFIAMLRGDPWLPPFTGRIIKHNMDSSGPRLSENYHEAIRQQNRAAVLEAMASGCQSVEEIAKATGLNYTTAKSHLDKLIVMGKVEMSEAKTARGRKKIYRVTK